MRMSSETGFSQIQMLSVIGNALRVSEPLWKYHHSEGWEKISERDSKNKMIWYWGQPSPIDYRGSPLVSTQTRGVKWSVLKTGIIISEFPYLPRAEKESGFRIAITGLWLPIPLNRSTSVATDWRVIWGVANVKEKTLKPAWRQTALNAVLVGRRIGIKLHDREGSSQINI